MENLGVISVTYRDGDGAFLERFTLPKEQQADRLRGMAREVGAPEMIYLATCNRVEIAFRSDGSRPLAAYRPLLFQALAGTSPEPGEAERTFRAWGGEGAAEHLFLVAAGLDSAQPGEREVRSQLKDAVRTSRELGLCRGLLGQILTEALRAAARVHREVQAGAGPVSLADIAAEYLLERARRTRDSAAGVPGRVALVGVSPMTRRCARRLKQEGVPIWIVNRTLERAEGLAAEVGGDVSPMALDELRRRPPAVEAVLLATGSPEPILGRRELELLAARSESGEAPLIVDMAIPPDVDPEAARQVGVPRLSMREIAAEADASRRRRLQEMAPARELIDEALDDLRQRLTERMLAPVLAGLGRRYRQTVTAGLDRLLDKELPELSPEERDRLQRWGEVLARRLAHIPTVGLRALASDAGPGAVRAFVEAADGDLARDFTGAMEAWGELVEGGTE